MVLNAKNALAYSRVWHEVDATGQVLGRLANSIAHVLMGKHKPIFHPKADCGDYVVVKNMKKIVLSGNKSLEKTYTYYTGYPGGLRVRPIKRYMDIKPESILRRAVYGMLPRAKRVRLHCINRLFIFPHDDHPHKSNIFKSYTYINNSLPSIHPLFQPTRPF